MIVNLRQLAEIKSNPQASNVPALCDTIDPPSAEAQTEGVAP